LKEEAHGALSLKKALGVALGKKTWLSFPETVGAAETAVHCGFSVENCSRTYPVALAGHLIATKVPAQLILSPGAAFVWQV